MVGGSCREVGTLSSQYSFTIHCPEEQEATSGIGSALAYIKDVEAGLCRIRDINERILGGVKDREALQADEAY
jgi:hypothetical protein